MIQSIGPEKRLILPDVMDVQVWWYVYYFYHWCCCVVGVGGGRQDEEVCMCGSVWVKREEALWTGILYKRRRCVPAPGRKGTLHMHTPSLVNLKPTHPHTHQQSTRVSLKAITNMLETCPDTSFGLLGGARCKLPLPSFLLTCCALASKESNRDESWSVCLVELVLITLPVAERRVNNNKPTNNINAKAHCVRLVLLLLRVRTYFGGQLWSKPIACDEELWHRLLELVHCHASVAHRHPGTVHHATTYMATFKC